MELTERQIGYGMAIIDMISMCGVTTEIICVCRGAGISVAEVEAWIEKDMCSGTLDDICYLREIFMR